MLNGFDHFLIQAADLTATRDWYVEVLGFVEGPHPEFGFPVCWLYIGDKDVIHLTTSQSDQRRAYLGDAPAAEGGSGAVDHFAFTATGLAETRARFDKLGIAYEERQADPSSAWQVFMHDPNGIKVELNFPAAEAVGLDAPVTAQGVRR
ncbi:MAG: VOC family protein [Alphaproteobacteria bacterium]